MLTDPVLPHRENVYFSVGLDGSSFMSLSDPILPLLERIVKLAAFRKQQKCTIYNFKWILNILTWFHSNILYNTLQKKSDKVAKFKNIRSKIYKF